jgi:hypothetical protein
VDPSTRALRKSAGLTAMLGPDLVEREPRIRGIARRVQLIRIAAVRGAIIHSV